MHVAPTCARFEKGSTTFLHYVHHQLSHHSTKMSLVLPNHVYEKGYRVGGMLHNSYRSKLLLVMHQYE
jgi:hypothetical protein